jgi:Flp pilus assembly protein TadD
LLRLQLNDHDGYDKGCALTLERLGRFRQDAGVCMQVAWICALAPGALGDLRPAVELAQMAVRASPQTWATHSALGAILYRDGRLADAVAELTESIRLNPAGGTAADFLFLAMAHHGLGKPEEAKNWLAKAVQAVEKQAPVMWTDRVEFQLRRREAEALLKGEAPEPKK